MPAAVLEETVGAQISSQRGQVLCFQTDVSQEEPVRQMARQTIDQLGTINILANVVGATSKMAIIGFARTLAADVGRYNITVNAICPGFGTTLINGNYTQNLP